MRALVVDDVPEIRELITVLLHGGGFRVDDVAESAEEAFLRLHLDDPSAAPTADVILLDVMLPGIDGIAACSRIKSDPRYRNVPVLMVTARQETASLQEAFAAGAADYIRKPVQKSELLARVRSALRLRTEPDRRLEPAPARAEGPMARTIHPGFLLPHRDLIEAVLEAAAAGERSSPMALAIFGIDGQAGIRERSGDDVADRLTAALADRLGREAGQLGDLLAHDGEGRLLALLRRVQAPEAEDRVRRALAAAAPELAEPIGIDAVTVSAGLAWCPADLPGGLRELPGRALAALHAATNAGGSRLEVA